MRSPRLAPRAWSGALVLALAGWCAAAQAQDIEPRAYSNAPIGVNFAIAGYAYADGGLVTDPSTPLENANITTHTALLAYARVLDTWGRSSKFDVVVPYASLSGSADFLGVRRERDVDGFADPRLRYSINLYGAPALSLPEFAQYRQDLIVGASVQVSLPAGQYDGDRLVNIGTNRAFVRVELGLSKAWGPWTLELAAPVTFFEDNDDFFGGQRLEQDPVYALTGGLVYSLRRGMWLAVNGTYYTGGRTTLDGVDKDDRQGNSRLAATFAMPVDKRNSVKFYVSSGVSTRTGTDFDVAGVAWQHRWGAGL